MPTIVNLAKMLLKKGVQGQCVELNGNIIKKERISNKGDLGCLR